MPLEFWVQAAHRGLRIVEIPVPLIYLDEERSFGGSLDDGRKRLEYYHRVLDRAIAEVELDAEPTEPGLSEADEDLELPASASETPPVWTTGCRCS